MDSSDPLPIRFLAQAETTDPLKEKQLLCKSNGDVHVIDRSEYLQLEFLLIFGRPKSVEFANYYRNIDLHDCED